MNILLYLFILLIGAFIGSKDFLKPKLLNRIGSIQTLSLLFLLFIMGVKIGLDKEIIFSLATIGLHSIILAVASIVFSILGVKLVSSKILREKVKVGDDI
ncbi:lysine exporter LysO family protein [Alkaliphilus pronyensis]|uniref:Lysine exporter LysO family protein n=1 Tax=Alkaliphilus pronyensis TaxID=1482732 RepID=A0A6I0FDL4_9FIRM|nr:LysO family transporter [Alkaliphilus pronyensis]KAB3537346.1 lysine exporter LysO family protein [Alkaliphilus pronyensis]